MTSHYVFRDADVNELIYEIFNSPERLEAREYKTIKVLDERFEISVEQVHLIMHVFFVDLEAPVDEKVKMVAEVLLAGADLANDYPEENVLEAKMLEVRQVFDLFSEAGQTKH